MRKSYNAWKRIFLAPDGTASGGTGDASSQQGGAKADDENPLSKVDLNDLDPETRKLVEAAKEKLASLQKGLTDAEAKKQLAELQAQKLQSERDKLKNGQPQ